MMAAVGSRTVSFCRVAALGAVAAVAFSADSMRAQPDSGQTTYDRACATCHGPAGQGSFGPSLVPFTWTDQALLSLVRSGGSQMLPLTSQAIGDADVASVARYLRGLGSTDSPSRNLAAPARRRSDRRFTAVTDAMLASPSPNDWLSWRRTLDGWGHSPLTEVNRSNVRTLRLAWSWALEPGISQTAPLVYDGVMYLANPGNIVQALDARTGDLLWTYRHPLDEGRRKLAQTRSLAIYRDVIVLNTVDARVVALDARTGQPRWNTQVGADGSGFTFTSGALVAGGVIVVGLTGCARFDNETCYIIGLDPTTGRELWRTSTIARPGEPGGTTWGDLPLKFRAGGDAWMTGTYDPDLKLIYWGTAQAKPWAQVVRGTDGEALYTNSTLALDPASGAIKWHFQHIPGESYDMDEAFERVLIDHDGRRSAYTMGKLGILWELDRVSGAFVRATDLGYQTLVDLDPRTGRVTYKPGMVQAIGQEVSFCPSTGGFKSLRAMAYSPDTKAMYVPLNLNCETATFEAVELRDGGGGVGPVKVKEYRFHPKSPGQLGELAALDVRNGAALWSVRRAAPFNTATLSTGGGLVFVGSWDRYALAYDSATGRELWQARLPTMTNGAPIAYAAGGTEYIAFSTSATTRGLTWAGRVPAALLPDMAGTPEGNALFVFSLPQ